MGDGWTVTFRGCEAAHVDCDAARFEVAGRRGKRIAVEVRTTAQIEHILARELGRQGLDASDRAAILAVAGRRLIEESLAEWGAVQPLLFLDSRLFLVPGAKRRLLKERGLLPAGASPRSAGSTL
jgi:hypothetical protein